MAKLNIGIVARNLNIAKMILDDIYDNDDSSQHQYFAQKVKGSGWRKCDDVMYRVVPLKNNLYKGMEFDQLIASDSSIIRELGIKDELLKNSCVPEDNQILLWS